MVVQLFPQFHVIFLGINILSQKFFTYIFFTTLPLKILWRVGVHH